MQGRVLVVFETKHISERFSKREFVIEANDGRYSQMVLFESSGHVIEELDMYRDGDDIRVHFNVRGREWRSPKGETKYFNSLHAWKLERVGVAPTRSAPSAGYRSDPANQPVTPPLGVDDDIPF